MKKYDKTQESISDLSMIDMLYLSQKLYLQHKDDWMKDTPESNIYWICFLVAEVGEVIDIVKKKGPEKIMEDKEVRREMLEEITDCYMYLADILNRYKFTSEEFSEVYQEKMKYNFKRDYSKGKTKKDKE